MTYNFQPCCFEGILDTKTPTENKENSIFHLFPSHQQYSYKWFKSEFYLWGIFIKMLIYVKKKYLNTIWCYVPKILLTLNFIIFHIETYSRLRHLIPSKKKIEFDFARQKRGKTFSIFFLRYFAFSNNFKVLIEDYNLFSLHRSRDKVVKQILISQTVL